MVGFMVCLDASGRQQVFKMMVTTFRGPRFLCRPARRAAECAGMTDRRLSFPLLPGRGVRLDGVPRSVARWSYRRLSELRHGQALASWFT